jgi:hypothetical protein
MMVRRLAREKTTRLRSDQWVAEQARKACKELGVASLDSVRALPCLVGHTQSVCILKLLRSQLPAAHDSSLQVESCCTDRIGNSVLGNLLCR